MEIGAGRETAWAAMGLCRGASESPRLGFVIRIYDQYL